jgi:hypothetical protein
MSDDLSTPLVFRIMRLGHSLHEAQCLTEFIMVCQVVVYTIMGFRISTEDDNSSDDQSPFAAAIPGIHSGTTRSSDCGVVNFTRGCPESLTCLFLCS